MIHGVLFYTQRRIHIHDHHHHRRYPAFQRASVPAFQRASDVQYIALRTRVYFVDLFYLAQHGI
jgi:hypothetical protein